MLYFLISVLLLLPALSYAELQTIEHTIQQPFAGNQSPDDARIAAISKAKREALERAGTYLESTTVVKDAQLDSDEIVAITAGVAKSEVLSQKNYVEEGEFLIEVKVKVTVDTDILDKSLATMLQNRSHLKDLKEAKVREKELINIITALQKSMGNTVNSKLNKELAANTRYLQSVDFYINTLQLCDGDSCVDENLALNYINKAIKLDPKNYTYYNIRGLIYRIQKKYNKSMDDFNTSLKLNSNYQFAYNNRGLIYSKFNKHSLAIADFTKAISIDPTFSGAYVNRGRTYSDLKKYDAAFNDFKTAIKYNGQDYKAYANRGMLHKELGNFENAYQDFTQAININPFWDFAYFSRGALLYKSGKYRESIDDYNQAIKLSPDKAYYYNIGNSYGELKEHDKAIEYYTKAIQNNLETADVYNNRGWMYMLLGDYQRALPDLNMSIKINSKNAVAYLNRGVTLVELNQEIRSCSDFKMACKLGNCKSLRALQSDGFCL